MPWLLFFYSTEKSNGPISNVMGFGLSKSFIIDTHKKLSKAFTVKPCIQMKMIRVTKSRTKIAVFLEMDDPKDIRDFGL